MAEDSRESIETQLEEWKAWRDYARKLRDSEALAPRDLRSVMTSWQEAVEMIATLESELEQVADTAVTADEDWNDDEL